MFPCIQTSLNLTEELFTIHYITFACIQTRHEKTEYTIVLYNIAFACNQTSMDLMTEELIALCYNTLHNIMFVVELITFEILAAERLRLMGFDNRLIIDCFTNVVNILFW